MIKIMPATKAKLRHIVKKEKDISYYTVKMAEFLTHYPDFRSEKMQRVKNPDWYAIGRANYQVNHKEYTSDQLDEWIVSATGDCEDKAFAKMVLLRKLGIPQGAMSFCICNYHDVRHACLWLHTDRGDYALDIVSDVILPWNKYPGIRCLYIFNSGKWFSVDGVNYN